MGKNVKKNPMYFFLLLYVTKLYSLQPQKQLLEGAVYCGSRLEADSREMGSVPRSKWPCGVLSSLLPCEQNKEVASVNQEWTSLDIKPFVAWILVSHRIYISVIFRLVGLRYFIVTPQLD